MTCRVHTEPDWIRLISPKHNERRSVWVRIYPETIEFCGGREGDDEYVCLKRNDTNSLEDLFNFGGNPWATYS